ncbi:MAG: polysaccharide biosynthesis tyrosine autokinase [Firmicutes bacterium]|nr:polysaccharide biosynthesis tyrosine autokinase [Bacillota bacterium]
MNSVIMSEASTNQWDFWRIYRILRKRIWLILAAVIITVGTAVVGLQFFGRQYIAYRYVQPSESILRPPGDRASSEERGARDRKLATLLQLANSPGVAEMAMTMTYADISAAGEEVAPGRASVAVLSDVGLTREEIVEMRQKNRIQAQVNTASGESGRVNTDLIVFVARAPNPQQAKAIVDTFTVAFKRFYEEYSRQSLRANVNFLKREVESARAKLDAKEKELKELRQQKGIVDLQSAVQGDYSILTPLRQKAEELQTQLASTRTLLAEKRRQFAQTPETLPDPAGKTVAAQELEKELATLTTQYTSMRGTYTEENPIMQQLQRRIREVQQKLQEEERNRPRVTNAAYLSLREEIRTLEAKERALATELAQTLAQVSKYEQRLAGYRGLDVDIQAATADYQMLLDSYNRLFNQYQAALLNLNANTESFITLMGQTSVEGPVRAGPNPMQVIIAAILLSLFLGIGIAVGLEVVDNTVKTTADAQQLIGLPVTGVIPRLESGDSYVLPKITHVLPASPHAESYRFVGEDILLTLEEHPNIRSIMVATVRPGQGGTSTIANLAITLAQGGKRVILVDGDMRRPSLHKVFNVSNDVGLSSVLSNGLQIAEVLRPTEVDNLVLVPAGPIPKNPWQLLRSQKMQEVVDALEQSCDIVLFDTPSAAVFADASVMASLVDGVVVVVRANHIPRGSELQVRHLLNKAKVRLLGVVLNDAAPEMVDSYYYHSHYYHTNGKGELPPPSSGKPSSGAKPVTVRQAKSRRVSAPKAEKPAETEKTHIVPVDPNARVEVRREDVLGKEESGGRV